MASHHHISVQVSVSPRGELCGRIFARVLEAGRRIVGRNHQNAELFPAFHAIGFGPFPVCFVCSRRALGA